MKIYTSYFGLLKNLYKDNIIPIAICRYIPKYYTGLVYQDIAPTPDILNNCKGNHSEYRTRFNNEILLKLNPYDVINYIKELSNNKDCALLCYENGFDNSFCHRFIVSDWINLNIPEINIVEYNPYKAINTNALF